MDRQGTNRGITIKVVAYHGRPKDVNGIPTLDRVEALAELQEPQVVNDPYLPCPDSESLDELLERFQAENGCKVSYLDEDRGGELREFELFEPAWPDRFTAHAAACDLASLLSDFTQGQ